MEENNPVSFKQIRLNRGKLEIVLEGNCFIGHFDRIVVRDRSGNETLFERRDGSDKKN